jgi:hypothetical protein
MWPPDQLMSNDKASDLLSFRYRPLWLVWFRVLDVCRLADGNISVLAKNSGRGSRHAHTTHTGSAPRPARSRRRAVRWPAPGEMVVVRML